MKRIWNSTSGDIFAKLEYLRIGLGRWAGFVRSKKEGLKRDLTRKLEEMMDEKIVDENLVEFIDTKILLNLDIDKDEMY